MHNGRVLITLLAGSAAFLALILLTPLGLWQGIGSAGMTILCVAVASGLAALAVFSGSSPKADAEAVRARIIEATE